MSKSATIELKEIKEIVTLEECNNEIKKCYFMINTLQMKSLKEHYDKLFEKQKEWSDNAIKMAKIEAKKEEKKRKEIEESNLRKQQVEKEIQEGKIKKQMIMNEINKKKEEFNEKELLINNSS